MNEELIGKILLFLQPKDNREVISLPMIPLDTIEDILELFDYGKRDDNDECINGWQIDFWYKFSNGEKELLLSGSLWYGDFELRKIKE